jgi:hypothetical protein
VEKQRSEEAKKQKRGEAEKQRIIKAEKNWEKQNSKKQKHTSKKMPKTEKNIFTPKITLQILTSSIIHRIGPEGDERRATRAGRRQKDRERERDRRLLAPPFKPQNDLHMVCCASKHLNTRSFCGWPI